MVHYQKVEAGLKWRDDAIHLIPEVESMAAVHSDALSGNGTGSVCHSLAAPSVSYVSFSCLLSLVLYSWPSPSPPLSFFLVLNIDDSLRLNCRIASEKTTALRRNAITPARGNSHYQK